VAVDDLYDREALTTREYATPDRLRARLALYQYRDPPHDPVDSAVPLLHETPGPLLDVGCGPGRYLEALRADRPDRAVFGADLSMGMLRAIRAPVFVADAATLPVRTASCGTVLAMHVLYHVYQPEVAVAELARVRAPGGTVLLATNGTRDKDRVRALHAEVVQELTGGPVFRAVHRRFSLEEAEHVAHHHFRSVRRFDFRGTISVPDPEPVIRWLGSMTAPDVTPAVLDEVRSRVAAVISREGIFSFRTHSGFLLCR